MPPLAGIMMEAFTRMILWRQLWDARLASNDPICADLKGNKIPLLQLYGDPYFEQEGLGQRT